LRLASLPRMPLPQYRAGQNSPGPAADSLQLMPMS
jgi:hypothetical protein